MAGRKIKKAPQNFQANQEGITRITVGNFKSIVGEQSIDIKPLTILAGANSSGKSSMMQPLLLLKQTLEAQYDPGALLLDGPNVNFSQAEQLLARGMNGDSTDTFSVGIILNGNESVKTFLREGEKGTFEVEKTAYADIISEYCISLNMSQEELEKEIRSYTDRILAKVTKPSNFVNLAKELMEKRELYGASRSYVSLFQNRCFLDYSHSQVPVINVPELSVSPYASIIDYLHQMLHLPGLRGNPQRTYPLIPLGPNFTNFAGTFGIYTASVIYHWQKDKRQEVLNTLNRDLAKLGLTNKIVARQLTGAHIELLVNRFLHNRAGAEDMVNIADVGFGVSQALPVVVALHAADPGQLVYIEQPEIHLHPRAQVTLADVMVDAALKGKRIVIETHSSLLLLGIQTLVAEGKIPPELVRLHWFTQQEDGSTKITSANLDRTGAYGDWPEDFDTISLDSESRYIRAAQSRLEE
jgi:predicted ATPase